MSEYFNSTAEFLLLNSDNVYTRLMGVFLYWVPLVLCLVGYFVKTWNNYQKDVKCLNDSLTLGDSYYHTDTIGDLLARLITSVIPVVNLLALIFDIAPNMFSKLFNWVCNILSTPLVSSNRK